MNVRTAFISGPMYDPLYERLAAFSLSGDVALERVFDGDHPALNEFLTSPAAAECDVVSTHTKYAPSQKALLAPLDDFFNADELADFKPETLNLARFDGKLHGIPRNIDLRLLHYRTDLIDALPVTWDDLLNVARAVNRPPAQYGFVFPGMESGLFGTFYELCEAGGAELFPEDLVPQIVNEGGRWALSLLRTFYVEGLVSPEITHWHYDKVHDAFRDGHAAMVGDWPGYYSDLRDPATSSVHNRFSVAVYPIGPTGQSRVYGGSHTFALTSRGAQNPAAVALLRFLTNPDQQLLEARHGSVPVRTSVMQQIQAESDAVGRSRWETLESALAGVVIPPKFERYPEVEEILWRTVQAAMVGDLGVDAALIRMTEQIRSIVGANA